MKAVDQKSAYALIEDEHRHRQTSNAYHSRFAIQCYFLDYNKFRYLRKKSSSGRCRKFKYQ